MLLKAFSLIEVLVVASILAILSAVAIPAYKTYKTRVAITNVHNYLQGLAQQLATKYQQTGSWPASIDFAGTTVTSGNTAPGSCTENVPLPTWRFVKYHTFQNLQPTTIATKLQCSYKEC